MKIKEKYGDLETLLRRHKQVGITIDYWENNYPEYKGEVLITIGPPGGKHTIEASCKKE